ncbi:MAG: hypothetical protein WC708_15785 [Lentisphaeria bacterium]
MGQAPKKQRPAAPSASGRTAPRWTAVILAAAVVAGGLLWWTGGRHAAAPPTAVPMTVAATDPPVVAAPPPGFAQLKGRWQRPDGGYILDLQGVAANGKLTAGYFNPRRIHVARAEASQEGTDVKVFVELRDVNYPGSTYTLAYDPAQDRLTGTYFQAALRQTFDVSFQRVVP